MKHLSVTFTLVIFWLLPLQTWAQIQISFPTNRAVFQRNAANQANFRITGFYTSALTRIEAKVTARDGQGTSTDWQTIQNNPTGGVYAGELTVAGGWYVLEVRGMNGNQPVGNPASIERVGVGEVFIIAGQSNAQGVHQDAPDPGNDRVNCVNYRYPDDAFPNDPPAPTFARLENSGGFTVGPRGLGSWCWGQLGDLLVKRLNVPVLFFNAAFSGTAVQNWRESAPDGGTAFSIYNGNPYPARQPYINLKLALQFYANSLGVRAVLWHQGEADNLNNTPTDRYVSDLQAVINRSRQEFGRNVSWVVARATYGADFGGVDAAIIAAQNQVISSTSNVFEGPNTDVILPRYDGLHFSSSGLVDAANAWNNSLNDQFFQRSVAHGPALVPTVSVACADGNRLTFTVNGDYPTIQWESGESGKSITKGAGALYRAKVKDGLGNTFFTSYLRVADAPVVSTVDNRPPSVCAGTSLALTTNYDNVTWINQPTNATVATTRQFNTTEGGAYYVRYRDVSGCDFTSNVLPVSVNPLPATPIIASDKPTTFCQGDNTVLRTTAESVRYNWSGGQQGRVVTVSASGDYSLTVTDQNGCTSAPSNVIPVTVNPLPTKPVIQASGPTTFCADQSITLTAPAETAYRWSNNTTARSLTTNQSGTFAVQTVNQFGCASELSDIVTIRVNPLPATPSVTATGATTFCDGNRVDLVATSQNEVVWSSGQTDKTVTIRTSGTYSARSRDQNGCLSPASPGITVRVNPLPAAPTLLANRPTTLCDGDRITFRIEGPYTVFWNTGDSTQSITTGRAGNYSARVRDVNGCLSPESAPTVVDVKPLPPAPTVNQIGTYTLEAVSSTNGTLFRWRRGDDSLAASTAVIKANQSGVYTARSSIVYSPVITCFSLPSTPYTFTVDASNQGLSVYPNPNPDRIVVLETQENLINATITISTLTGQLVYSVTSPTFDERKQLVLTNLLPGSYVLRVRADGFDVAKRILLGL